MEYRKLSILKELPGNPRRIDKKQFEILCKSIKDNKEYFEARPLILSDRTGELIIIAGNQRYKAAKELKYKEVPTYLLNGLTEEKEKEIIIRDNINNGEWEWDTLANEWDAEQLTDWGLEIPDFKTNEGVEEDDFAIPATVQADIMPGDLFEIGPHRLLCGDSTNSDDAAKLMNGALADLVFTDPPYDLDNAYGENLFIFSKEDCHVFVMNSDKNIILLASDYQEYFKKIFAVDFRQARLVSNNQPMTRVDLIAEFNKGKGKFVNTHDGFSTLIECAKIHSDKIEMNHGHKQAKRIELPAKFVEHYSSKGEIVLDLFLGAGSTLMACDQLGRVCYGMEKEPANCFIIISRILKDKPLLEVKRNGEIYLHNPLVTNNLADN